MKKIAILGAGITGLAAAYFIQKRFGNNVTCTVFEASDRSGGWIKSIEHNGAIFELGPRTLRSSKELDALVEELNLEPLFAAHDAKKRYIATEGALHALPTSALELITTKLGRKILFALVKNSFCSKTAADDESVEQFFKRRMGKSGCDTFISALTNGIYAALPEELSMRSCFPAIWEKRTLFMPAAHSFNFSRGVEMLSERLSCGLSIRYKSAVDRIEELIDSVLVNSEPFDHLISTIQPSKLLRLLPDNDPWRPFLSVPTTSLVAITVAYTASQAIPDGFGFLCTKSEDDNLLGIVFDSNLFPKHNGGYETRLSVMFGGSKNPELAHYSDAALVAFTKEVCKKYLNIHAEPDFLHITRAVDAISRYPVGHYKRLEALRENKRRISALGSGLTGVSVGDCVTQAYECVYKKIDETLMSP